MPPGRKSVFAPGTQLEACRVDERIGTAKNGSALFRCTCKCGAVFERHAGDLRRRRNGCPKCRKDAQRNATQLGTHRTELFEACTPRLQEIAAWRRGGMMLKEIAAKLGVSKQRVHQLLKKHERRGL